MNETERSEPIALEIYESVAQVFADIVETRPWNAYYEQPATRSLIPDISGKHVLDAGCGPGVLSEWLIDNGAEVVAVDISPKMVELAARRLGEKAVIQIADLGGPLLFLGNESFDVVVGSLSFDYIGDWDSLFSEFHRILTKDGLLIFSVGHPFNDFLKGGTDNYFATEIVEMYWPSLGVRMPCYRRPLQAVVSAVLDAGFVLDKLIEPLPTEKCKQEDPEAYDLLSKWPAFLCVRALKS